MRKSFVVPTRNVVLTDCEAGLVERLIASGRYENASEVLREGLRLLEQSEAKRATELTAVSAALTKPQLAALPDEFRDDNDSVPSELERQA